MLRLTIGAAVCHALLSLAPAEAADQTSYTVNRFEWTAEEGCVAVGNDARNREVVDGVNYTECQAVIGLRDVQIDYTHAENGAGYLVRMVSPQMNPFTCWYGADGKPAVCQDQ